MYNPTIKHWKSQSFLYFSFFFWSLPNARYMSFLTCFCFLALMTPILSISFWCLDTLSLILILSDFNLCRYRFCTIFIILLTYNKKFNFKWEMAIVVFHWAFLIQNMLIKSFNSFIWFFYPKKRIFLLFGNIRNILFSGISGLYWKTITFQYMISCTLATKGSITT